MIKIEIDNNKIQDYKIENIFLNSKINDHTTLIMTIKNLKDINLYSKTIALLINNQIIFSGIVISIKQEKLKYKQNIITIKAKSNTILLDREKRQRVFQDQNTSYDSIINEILSKYNIKYILSDETKQKIKKMYVQYFETDFEFIRRILSDIKEYIYSSYRGVISFGANKLNNINIKNKVYEDEKISNDSITQTKKLVDECYLAGDIENNKIITKSKIYLENNKLMCKLKLKNNKDINYLYHSKIKGAFLTASVVECCNVQEIAKMKVKYIDFEDNSTEKKQISFATPYSKIMTGMYVSPQVGDVVDVYFGSDDDGDPKVAFCINNDKSNRFLDSNNRNFFTDNCNFEINKDSLNILANSILCNTKNDIAIYSQNSINIESKIDMGIYSNSIDINSDDNDINMISKKNINLKAKKINNN